MVHLVGVGGREFSVGRLADCRIPFAESTLTALGLRIRKCKLMENAEKSVPPKTQHEIHSSQATASNSRRHARKHVPIVSPHSPASIDPEFVEIGLVQLSQSVKTTNVTHTHTDRLIK